MKTEGRREGGRKMRVEWREETEGREWQRGGLREGGGDKLTADMTESFTRHQSAILELRPHRCERPARRDFDVLPARLTLIPDNN
ncbi:hypothetical protein E2C01_065802 [Portunus trituberculatus]|uniref:Uncharacterized protein n=1 Tax=Portunus trituberculatus TaxID=210409 RepID=A0A5B7HPE6_PORTR|nr:hypothetical protein [Portunus trituberculatus]